MFVLLGEWWRFTICGYWGFKMVDDSQQRSVMVNYAWGWLCPTVPPSEINHWSSKVSCQDGPWWLVTGGDWILDIECQWGLIDGLSMIRPLSMRVNDSNANAWFDQRLCHEYWLRHCQASSTIINHIQPFWQCLSNDQPSGCLNIMNHSQPLLAIIQPWLTKLTPIKLINQYESSWDIKPWSSISLTIIWSSLIITLQASSWIGYELPAPYNYQTWLFMS